MKLRDKILENLRKEGNYIVKQDDLDTIGRDINQEDPEAVIKVIDEEEVENPMDSMYVAYEKPYSDETPFEWQGKKFQYCWGTYPNGKVDIAVYAFSGDVTYGYKWFRKYVLGINESTVNEAYNTYAICTDSIAKTAGTSERSEWSEAELERYESCIKGLKGKKGYKLGESVNPKMTKNELVETILKIDDKKVVKKIKVKDILK